MLISEVWRGLIDAGIEMVPVDARHLELRRGRHSAQIVLHASPRVLSPSDVAAVVHRHRGPGLLVVPAATIAARRAAERAGWSWLVTGPGGVHGVIRLGDDAIRVGEQDPVESKHTRPGRVPWGSLTMMRRLLEQPPTTQKVLASAADVSQPRVSQTLAALADRHLVERVDAGWVVRDFDGLLRLWLEIYPGHGGIGTYWYGLDPPRAQAQAVIRLATTLADTRSVLAHDWDPSTGEPFAVLSGDVAADLIAPWRSPTRAVIYARAGVDLAEGGLTPAGADDASLELIVPQDPGVWPRASGQWPPRKDSATRADTPMPIADTLQVLWDVQRAPGSDSSEAVARLWEIMRERSRAVHGGIES